MLKPVLTKMIKQIYTHRHTHTLYHDMNVIFQPVAHTKHQLQLCVTVPDVAVSRPVLEEPAVRGLIFPANIASVFPQELHLIGGVARVPQSVPQVFTWTCV